MNKEGFSIKARIKSFKHALQGLKVLWKEEHNSRIHLIAAIVVIALAFYYELKDYEYFAIIGAIGAVVVCEIFNTAMEQLCNLISTEYNESIKKIKDLSAAAVLISAVLALIVGAIIFLPRTINLF